MPEAPEIPEIVEREDAFARMLRGDDANVSVERARAALTEANVDSTKIVARWIREEKLETLIPSEPKIASGKIVAHSDRVMVPSTTAPHSRDGGPGLPGPPSFLLRARLITWS